MWSSLVPPLPLLSLSLLTERGEAVSLDPTGVLALLYVVVLSTLLGFGVWAWLLGQHPASTVAPFTLLVPVVGIATAWIALAEVPSATELAGSAVVLGGLALTVGLTGTRREVKARESCAPHWFAAAAAFLVLVAAAPAQAAQTTYRVDDVRTAKQRAAVARTGAAIVEVDHGSVTVTASRSDLRALRRAGFKVVSQRAQDRLPVRRRGVPQLHRDEQRGDHASPTRTRRSPSDCPAASASRTRAASSSPRRSPTTSPPTRTSPRCSSPAASTRAST